MVLMLSRKVKIWVLYLQVVEQVDT
jgi:hypothetical protein